MLKRASRHVPERTCIFCRSKRAKSELHRLVLRQEESGLSLVLDRQKKMPGRGAYICRDKGCLQAALEDRARFHACVERAFRKRIKNLDFRGLREGNGKDKSA